MLARNWDTGWLEQWWESTCTFRRKGVTQKPRRGGKTPSWCMDGRKGSSMQQGSRLNLSQPGTHVGWYWALHSLPSRSVHSSLLGSHLLFQCQPSLPRWKVATSWGKRHTALQGSLPPIPICLGLCGKDQWTKENQQHKREKKKDKQRIQLKRYRSCKGKKLEKII